MGVDVHLKTYQAAPKPPNQIPVAAWVTTECIRALYPQGPYSSTFRPGKSRIKGDLREHA